MTAQLNKLSAHCLHFIRDIMRDVLINGTQVVAETQRCCILGHCLHHRWSRKAQTLLRDSVRILLFRREESPSNSEIGKARSPILCLLPDVVLVCYNSRLDWSKLMLMHTDWSSVVLNPLLKRRSVLLRDDPSGVGGLVGRRVCLPHTQQCFLPRFVVTVHPVEAPLTAVEALLAGQVAVEAE